MGVVSYRGVDYSNKGPRIQNISEEEYQALVQAGEVDPNTIYFRYDGETSFPPVQNDGNATSLIDESIPTGQTIDSVLSSNLVDNSSVTGFEFRKSKANVVTVTRTGSPVLSTDGITVNAQIPVGYRPSAEARAVGKVYNGSSYVDCTIGFGSDGYIKIRTLTGSAVSGIQTSFLYPTFVTYVV